MKQPADGLPPVLILIEPAESEPLTLDVPPLPKAPPLLREGLEGKRIDAIGASPLPASGQLPLLTPVTIMIGG